MSNNDNVLNKEPLVFHEVSERMFEKFLKEGPFNTPKEMFDSANSAFKSGFQIGHEMAVHYGNYTNKRPVSKNALVEVFKVGLFNGLQRGFCISAQKKKNN